MILVDLFPAGVLQLWDAVSSGYWHSRRLTFTLRGTFHTLEWARVVGDLTFILLGAFPICLAAVRGYLKRERRAAQVLTVRACGLRATAIANLTK